MPSSSPPTRGCSPHPSGAAPAQRVLPAYAGVFPPLLQDVHDTAGPPRLRGGVPEEGAEGRVNEGSSPPTRGCSHETRSGHGRVPVLPAYAGVFPWSPHAPPSPCRPPRLRGGVPKRPASERPGSASSPPTRGCSVDTLQRHKVDPVLPAYAGVFRGRAPPTSTRRRPPRLRGGVPDTASRCKPFTLSSPPTRGCSLGRDHADRARRRPPRLRGGVPTTLRLLLLGEESSPPTRGCSPPRLPDVRPGRVLPAYAGVFPPAARPNRRACCPPRLRGGVPASVVIAGGLTMSSPPTRGCSYYRHARHGVLEVLPAYAGVFPGHGSRSARRRRPPRLRGGVPG